MSLLLDIARAVFPLVLVGGIAVFVIFRLKHKYNKGTLGKKKSKGAQMVLNSLLPFGMLIGSTVAVILSIFTPYSFVSTMTYGAGIGMLVGYFAYELYSRKEDSNS